MRRVIQLQVRQVVCDHDGRKLSFIQSTGVGGVPQMGLFHEGGT